MINFVKLLVYNFLLFLIPIEVLAQTYTNPFYLPNEWEGYGIGDPYVLKFRGIYYLYSSTKDGNIGIKVFSSIDLVNWQYRGFCTSDPITLTAYAPEVVYWNGKFYMYTSPAGNGHYVLEADNPLGPFTRVTENFGHSIDGSVFIDDDEQWYFYHAGMTIQGCKMTSPTVIGNAVSMGVTITNGWTEGPCVFKRNGVYYMIYTGNHVWSKGYRINYAINKNNPFSFFSQVDEQNPILLNSEGSWYGLGHGSIFIGPDLDSYFIVYHNFGPEGVPYRHLNIDRLTWNGDFMYVLGPTNFAQPVPELPVIYDYFNGLAKNANWVYPTGGEWNNDAENQSMIQNSTDVGPFFAIIDTTINCPYTAEYNFQLSSISDSSAFTGIVFNYLDTANYSTLLFFGNNQTVEYRKYIDGKIVNQVPIVFISPLDFRQWHMVRIKKSAGKAAIYIDNLKKLEINDTLTIGEIGYITRACRAVFGYTALSYRVNGSADFDAFKPIPGNIIAVHYNSGKNGLSYSDNTPGNAGGVYRDDDVDIFPDGEGGYMIGSNESGEWYSYNVNIQYSSKYMVGLKYRSSAVSKVKILLDGIDVTGEILLPSTDGLQKTVMFKTSSLQEGFHQLKVCTIEGEFDFYSLKIDRYTDVITQKGDNFDQNAFNASWNYTDGNWMIQNGQAYIDGFGKRTLGGTNWSNYVIEVDLKYTNQMNAGVIFRVHNPANGGAGNDPALGTDFLQGYFVGLNSNAIILGKHNYNWTLLKSVVGTYSLNKYYHLKIIVQNNTIKVYIDNSSNPALEYVDDNPFLTGKVGLRSHNTSIYFDNFMVYTFNDTLPNILNTKNKQEESKLKVFPNPVIDSLCLSSSQLFDEIEVYDVRGIRLFDQRISGKVSSYQIRTVSLEKGTYLIRVKISSTNQWVTTTFVKQ